jgi:uroporphyrinogen-III synthase
LSVTLPLAGRRILVTRGASQASTLSDGLHAAGAVPIEVPVLEIVPPESYEPLDAALRTLHSNDWLILTSVNTVRALVERAQVIGISLKKSDPGPAVAAVGEATAGAARDAGLTVSLVPKSYVAESLVAALQDRTAGKRILLARAAVARDVIPEALRAAGATLAVVDAYRNVLPKTAPQQLRHAYARGLDAATFTSSSTVTHLAEAARAGGLPFPLPGVPAVSIGPITSQTLRTCGWEPKAESDRHDIPNLILATVRYFSPAS